VTAVGRRTSCVGGGAAAAPGPGAEPEQALAPSSARSLRRLLPTTRSSTSSAITTTTSPGVYRSERHIYRKGFEPNDEIDRMRHSTTQSLMTRRDVLVVASISCIYGIGSVEDYMGESLTVAKGPTIRREVFLRKLNRDALRAQRLRLRAIRVPRSRRLVDLVPSNEEKVYRVEFFGDEIERIQELDATTGEILGRATSSLSSCIALRHAADSSGSRWWTSKPSPRSEASGSRITQAGRGAAPAPAHELRPGVLRETGTCAGIEELFATPHTQTAGRRPYTLLDSCPTTR